ncbi:MAG: putative transposase [Maribacter sp.]|jgi:putative transposase
MYESEFKREFVCTTNSNHLFPIANNVLDKNFTSTELGGKWVSDITYIRIGGNWNYLTTIMDLADRKIVGWSLSENVRVEKGIIGTMLLPKVFSKLLYMNRFIDSCTIPILNYMTQLKNI